MALCTSDDVATRLGGVTFTTTEAVQVGELIAAAQGHIEREAHRPIEADDYTEVFDGPDTSHIWLTNTPVNSITSVTVDGTALATSGAYTLDADTGRLTRTVNSRPRSWATSKLQTISVVYNGGYSTVPADLADLCARVAARAYRAGEASEAAPEGVSRVDIEGGGTVQYQAADGQSLAVILTPDEVEAARYYRNDYL